MLEPETLNPPIYIKVADGSQLRATHKGIVEIHFTSDQQTQMNLRLLRVLYVPGLQTRLFSIESFVSNGRCSAVYSKGQVKLVFPNNLSLNIELPHVPPGTYISRETRDLTNLSGSEQGMTTWIHSTASNPNEKYVQVTPDGATDTHFIGMAQEVKNKEQQEVEDKNSDPLDGGEPTELWTPTNWTDKQDARITNKRRMDVELAHNIFGHRAVSSLMSASNANIWDDLKLVFSGDSWCNKCKIAISPRNPMSKEKMRFSGVPLEHIFIDCVPSPGVLRGVKECRAKDFLFLGDPVSKYLDKINLPDKSTESTIHALSQWRGDMVKKGFKMFLHLRSDAGTNFTSEKFSQWCKEENINLTIAGPKHQEQNGFIESSYKTSSRMARSMLVGAHLPMSFFHLAFDYALLILRVMPAKGLVDSEGNQTTTYQILHNKKPRVRRFKVFGCPVVFKRYQPKHDGDTTTNFKQLQRGSRGIFVGFPKNQAGWLIYVDEAIKGSHLVVSMDVDFDQHFLSGISGTNKVFAQGELEKDIGKVGGLRAPATESTGDITNLIDSTTSHWGTESTYDVEHSVQPLSNNPYHLLSEQSEDEQSQGSTSESGDNHPEFSSDEHSDSEYFSDDSSGNNYGVKNLMKELPSEGSQFQHGVRRSTRRRDQTAHFSIAEHMFTAFEEIESVFKVIDEAAALQDIPIAPYLPEPKSLEAIKRLPDKIKEGWVKAIRKELKGVIEENETFRRGEELQLGDEIIPAMIIFKAKVTSRGYLDKLKARLVARGDLQQRDEDPDTLWSPCVFARTFKMFVVEAVKRNKAIHQLDFIGAFCQSVLKARLFLQLPKEYAELVPEYAEYFQKPMLLNKSLYGTTVAAKVWNEDLTNWLTTNKDITFIQSQVDPSLFIHRNGSDFIYLIVYIDDSLYFGSTPELEKKFETKLGERFKIDLQGWSHWFLGTRLYREKDGSYFLDQENYIKHILNRYCGKETEWGLPPMKDTPAPVDYVYSKDNRPKTDEEKEIIKSRFKGLSMASAVSSLLYAALNTRNDILWITNKLAKSSSCPGIKDFEALMHVFGYLRKHTDFGIRIYANVKESPAHQICIRHKIEPTSIIGFSDTSWQDCPDTGRSTCGYKIFVQGGIIDAQSTMPVPVALSSAEAEYMGACNLGAMICHLRDLTYEFEKLGTPEYKIEGRTKEVPSVLLIDNQATVRMSKNYKVTSKNRHVGRRWHFVRQGVKDKLFTLNWIPAEDQLADDCTKTQIAKKSKPHFERTLLKIPDYVKGFKSNTVGNR